MLVPSPLFKREEKLLTVEDEDASCKHWNLRHQKSFALSRQLSLFLQWHFAACLLFNNGNSRAFSPSSLYRRLSYACLALGSCLWFVRQKNDKSVQRSTSRITRIARVVMIITHWSPSSLRDSVEEKAPGKTSVDACNFTNLFYFNTLAHSAHIRNNSLHFSSR